MTHSVIYLVTDEKTYFLIVLLILTFIYPGTYILIFFYIHLNTKAHVFTGV